MWAYGDAKSASEQEAISDDGAFTFANFGLDVEGMPEASDVPAARDTVVSILERLAARLRDTPVEIAPIGATGEEIDEILDANTDDVTWFPDAR